MSAIELVILISLPLAFLHGWYFGRASGINEGAERAFDTMYKSGTPTDVKGVRIVELRNEDD